MAYGLGGFAAGLSEGFKSGWGFAEKMDERDKKRRAEQLGKEIAQLERDWILKDGEFKEPGDDAKAPARPAGVTTPQQPTQSSGVTPPPQAGVEVRPLPSEPIPRGIPLPEYGAAERPVAGTQSTPSVSFAEREMEAERRGVRQTQAPSPAVAEEPIDRFGGKDPVAATLGSRYQNPKMADNLYYTKLGEKVSELYSVTGQYDKIPLVRNMIRDMREKDFEPKKRFGVAMLLQNDPRGFEYANQSAEIAGLPIRVDYSSAVSKDGKFDGVRYSMDGGKTYGDPVSVGVGEAAQLLGAMTPMDVINYRFAEKKDNRDQTRLGFEANADTRAGNADRRADRELDRKFLETDAQIQYWKDMVGVRRQEVKNKFEELGIYKSAQALNQATQASTRAFQNIGNTLGLSKEYKPDELALLSQTEKDNYLIDRGEKMEIAGFAHNIWQMNNFGKDGKLTGTMPESVAIELARTNGNVIMQNSTPNGDGTRTLKFRGRTYLFPDAPQTQSAPPATDPKQTFSRTKRADGTYTYRPDPKGLTKSQWDNVERSGIPE